MRNNKNNIPLIAIIMAVIFLLGVILSGYFLKCGEAATVCQMETVSQEKTGVLMFVPALDNNGNGVVVRLSVAAQPGEDKILADIDKLLFWTDTQQSIQTARDIAKNFTGKCCFDIIYILDTDATVVGGPSAGAAFAIATIAAFEGRVINNSIAITGTINSDGTIGQVGGIREKAEAAMNYGATILLVPEGQSLEKELKPVEECAGDESFLYCEIKYKQVTTDISGIAGIKIIEVKDINEAAKYFFGE